MAEKKIKTRIQQKHDVEANWIKATAFIPMTGEIIVYDAETSSTDLTDTGRTSPITYERFKIGDGKTVVSTLPFTVNPHVHDDRYYTEGEVDAKLDTKAPTSHASTGTSYGAASASNYGHAKASTTTPKSNGTAAVGSETSSFARGDHVHPVQTSVSGNAGSADKVNKSLKVQLNSGTTEGTNQFTFDGSTAKNINITPSAIGAAASSHGTHVTYSTTTPKANGTASTGSASEVSRSDHVHPTDTTRAASSHTHGNITNAGALGTASRIVVTDTSKKITTGSIDPANLVVTTDSRLSDARTPVAHNHSLTDVNSTNAPWKILTGNNLEDLLLSTDSELSTLKRHSHTIAANASDDDVVVLSGTNGTNSVSYSASHAKKGPSTTASTTKGATADVEVSAGAGTKTIKVPKVTVDQYGHTTGLTEQTLSITIPTDTNTAHSHTVGTGLKKTGDGGISGDVKYEANLKSVNSLGTIGSTAKLYAVGVDSNGNLAVNVPWTDTNTQDGNDNQKVKTGSITFGANDVVEFVAGSNVSISGDATNKKITISATDTNTHDGNDNQTIKGNGTAFGINDAINIVGSGATTVTADTTNKKITISSSDTHNSHAIISGVKADGSTQIKGSASSGDITLGDSGVTAGEYGPTANATPSYGATFNVPDIKVNAKGIVTSVVNRTVKIPASDNTDTKVTSVDNHYTPTADSNAALTVDASSSTAATWGSTSLVTGVNLQRDAKGHVTGVTVDSIKMPSNPNSETTLTIVDKNSTDTTDLVYAVTNLVEGGTKGHTITPTYVGLPTKDYVDKHILTSKIGVANGVADLDANGKVPSSRLPSYVDDVLEYSAKSSFPTTGETGKIYVNTSDNKTYRWSGSQYVEISPSLALGETSSTAYRGDRGKTAYDHSQTTHAPSNAEANQNAFSYVKVGSTTVAADTKTDTLELVAGTNITITPDATNDKITIATLPVDSDLSITSTNPVQNKVVSAALDSKSDYTGYSFPAVEGARYAKICTVALTAWNSDMAIEFDMFGRVHKFQTVKCSVRKSSNTEAITAIYVSGTHGNVYEVCAYRHVDTTNGDYVDFWCKIPSWDVLTILKKAYADNGNHENCLTWDFTTASSLPTENTNTIKVTSYLEGWSGKAATAGKVTNNITVQLNGGTSEGTNKFTFDGSAYKAVNITPSAVGAAPTSHASTATAYGVSTASNYGHAKASATSPKAPGTAAVGSETSSFARGDHVHPAQTVVQIITWGEND